MLVFKMTQQEEANTPRRVVASFLKVIYFDLCLRMICVTITNCECEKSVCVTQINVPHKREIKKRDICNIIVVLNNYT